MTSFHGFCLSKVVCFVVAEEVEVLERLETGEVEGEDDLAFWEKLILDSPNGSSHRWEKLKAHPSQEVECQALNDEEHRMFRECCTLCRRTGNRR